MPKVIVAQLVYRSILWCYDRTYLNVLLEKAHACTYLGPWIAQLSSDDAQQELGPEFQSSTYHIPAIVNAYPVFVGANNRIQSMRFEKSIDEKSRLKLTRLRTFLSSEFWSLKSLIYFKCVSISASFCFTASSNSITLSFIFNAWDSIFLTFCFSCLWFILASWLLGRGVMQGTYPADTWVNQASAWLGPGSDRLWNNCLLPSLPLTLTVFFLPAWGLCCLYPSTNIAAIPLDKGVIMMDFLVASTSFKDIFMAPPSNKGIIMPPPLNEGIFIAFSK